MELILCSPSRNIVLSRELGLSHVPEDRLATGVSRDADIGAIEFVHNRIPEKKEAGAAI